MARTRTKKVLVGCASILLIAALAFVVAARRFLSPKHYDVVSIKATTDYQDQEELRRAFSLPVASAYEHATIAYQPNGSVCGPTSVANVLRSLGQRDATPKDVLAGSGKCTFGICFGGLTLDELAGLAEASAHRHVTELRDLTAAQFREHVAHANDPERRYIINFDRGPLFGTEGGHHSPIGGYLEKEDLVLVLDVNEKYKPWLVRTDRLYQAMDTVDPSTGAKRGMLLIQ